MGILGAWTVAHVDSVYIGFAVFRVKRAGSKVLDFGILCDSFPLIGFLGRSLWI